MAEVCHTQAKRRLAVVFADGNAVTEEDARRRSRETDEDQPGHYREPDGAEHDFGSNNDMPVNCGRIIMAVSNRSQSFDAEEEGFRKGMRSHFRDAIPDRVAGCEDYVN